MWDIHKLSDMMGYGEGGFKSLDPYDTNWHNIWIKSFNDDAGSSTVMPAATGFVPNIANLLNAEAFTYSGDISITPLIPAQSFSAPYSSPVSNLNYAIDSDVWMGEMALYNIALFPAMPFMIASSLPSHYHFGPTFMETMEFSVDGGGGTLSPVTITMSFKGGRSLVNASIPANIPSQVLITPQAKMFDLPNTYYPSTPVMRPYRYATISDCEIAFETFENVTQFLENTFNTSYPDAERISSMKLTITQEIQLIATNCNNSIPTPRTDTNGPKFAEVISRKVAGSITYTGRKGDVYDDIENLVLNQPLTMYFGGPFYFPMNYVDWQMPTMSMSGDGNIWSHTYKFIARTTDLAITGGFNYEAAGYPVSEFNIPPLNPSAGGYPQIDGGFNFGGGNFEE